MQTRSIHLNDFNIGLFKSLVGRSLMAVAHINLTINKDWIESKATSKSDALIKNWKYTTKDLWAQTDFEECYLSILNGGFFLSSVLGVFGDKVNITLQVKTDDNHVVSMLLEQNGLKINFGAAPLNISFEKMEAGEAVEIFNTEAAKSSFVLQSGDLARVLGLIKINKTADKPVNWVQFEGKDGKLFVRDTSFELHIGEYNGDPFSAKMHKSLLGQIDHEEHAVNFVKASGDVTVDRFVMQSLNPDIESKILVVLMLDIDAESSDEDFYKDDIDFDSEEKGW